MAKKHTTQFLKELDAIWNAAANGTTSFNLDDLRPKIRAALKKHRTEDSLWDDEVEVTIREQDRRRRRDDLSPDIFGYSDVVALGGGDRIRYGAMTLDHIGRRLAIWDKNDAAQARASARERAYLNDLAAHLKDKKAGTRVEEVRPDDRPSTPPTPAPTEKEDA
jgi:hypothetical protein